MGAAADPSDEAQQPSEGSYPEASANPLAKVGDAGAAGEAEKAKSPASPGSE